MLYLRYYLLLILKLSTYSNGEPIQGNNIVSAEEGEFPFIASIIRKTGNLNAEKDHICTGVLISKNHVLTAEHCLKGRLIDQIQIILGSVDLRNGTKYDANAAINYAIWADNKGIYKEPSVNDIAIVKLTEEVSEQVATPAKLSSKRRLNFFSNEIVTVAGWGYTNLQFNNRPARYLQKASLTLLKTRQCQSILSRLLNEATIVEEDVFCTNADPYTLLGCGDSGGPVLNGKNQVIGINMGTCPSYLALIPQHVNSRVNLHANVHYYKTFITDVLKNY